jgi:hypothetical protein
LSNGAGKLRCVIFDAEAAQMQGFGDYVTSINNPSISGLSVTDPLDLASRLAKTCSVHFNRFVFHFDNKSVSDSFCKGILKISQRIFQQMLSDD